MILDERLEFADAAALSQAGTSIYLLGDVIDLESARDVGSGEQLFLVIQVTTAVTSGGAATVKFILASDAAAAIALDGSATYHGQTFDVPKATLVADYQLVIPLPPEDPAYEQYLGVLTDVGTAALTAGAVNAFITRDVGSWKAYPDGI